MTGSCLTFLLKMDNFGFCGQFKINNFLEWEHDIEGGKLARLLTKRRYRV